MKLLLDENLPHQIRLELPGHDVFTAAYMKWSAIENGGAAPARGLCRLRRRIINDRGLEYEQNLDTLPVAVVAVLAKSNTLEAMRPLYPELLAALSRLQPRQFVKVAST